MLHGVVPERLPRISDGDGAFLYIEPEVPRRPRRSIQATGINTLLASASPAATRG